MQFSTGHTFGQMLLGGVPNPLKNMRLSIGMMKFPIYGKIKHVPSHQPECGCKILHQGKELWKMMEHAHEILSNILHIVALIVGLERVFCPWFPDFASTVDQAMKIWNQSSWIGHLPFSLWGSQRHVAKLNLEDLQPICLQHDSRCYLLIPSNTAWWCT